MIVVDTNVLVARILESATSEGVLRVMRQDPDWRVPLLWRYELQNVLATLIKAGRMMVSDALKHLKILEDLLRHCQDESDPEQVLRLVARHKITAYDANFVALALRLGCKLITEDAELLRKFPRTALSMRAFAGEA